VDKAGHEFPPDVLGSSQRLLLQKWVVEVELFFKVIVHLCARATHVYHLLAVVFLQALNQALVLEYVAPLITFSLDHKHASLLHELHWLKIAKDGSKISWNLRVLHYVAVEPLTACSILSV
jgi:hypothetical protein